MASLWRNIPRYSTALAAAFTTLTPEAQANQPSPAESGTVSESVARPANGETPTAPASSDAVVPRIQPPRALQPLAAEYPADAEGDHSVVLELLVDATGHVSSARVIQGDEPFASRAASTATGWNFSPAQRNGVPTAAKIRVEVIFTAPEPEPAEVSPAPAPAKPTGPEAAEEIAPPGEAVEVLVVGERAADVKRLGRAEVRQMPGAFGDPFRAIEALPGVTPIASGLPYFFIRGAPPGNVGYFFDQISIPLLYHAALGPGVIHPAFIDSVNLYAGAYPAKYGRYAGGIVEGTVAEPHYEWRGEASIRLLDAGAFVEAPFDSERGSLMLGGRYSYTGLIASLVAPEVDLGYWDYQTRAQYALSPETTLSLFAFGSHDFFQAEANGKTVNLLDLTFHRADAKVRRRINPHTSIDFDVIGGYNRTGSGGEGDDEDPVDIYGKSLGARVSVNHTVSRSLMLRAGIDSTFTRAVIDLNTDPQESTPVSDTSGIDVGPNQGAPPSSFPDPNPDYILPPDATSTREGRLPQLRLPYVPVQYIEDNGDSDEDLVFKPFYSRNDWVSGVWLEAVWQVTPLVTLTPGIRFDAYKTGSIWSLAADPRLTARFDITPGLSLIHTLGIAHQPPSFAIPIPGLDPVSDGGLQQAVQSSAGAELALPAKLTASVTAFQNVTLNSSDMLSTATYSNAAPDSYSLVERTTAHAYGIEFYLRRSLTEKLGGFLSYTLSRSTRSTAYASGLSSFDRTHMLNFALAYDLGRNWRLGARLVTYSGIPASVPYVAALKSPPRTDWYYRVDWRLEKRWLLGDQGAWISFVAEVLNTTLNEEVITKSCYAFGCEEERIGPVTLPSLGLEASF